MDEVPAAALEQVGGKAASLARLASGGIAVPSFFVIPSEAFSGDGLSRSARDAVLDAYGELGEASGHGVVAVRSSAAGEDSAAASFAGQYRSVLGVRGEAALLDAIHAVWASRLARNVSEYRRARSLAGPEHLAVIVQTQIFSERAGVLFTRHPLEPDRDLAYLEANFGTGESVVGGAVTPDSFSVSRLTGKVVESTIGTKRVCTVVSKGGSGSRVVPTDPSRQRLASLSDAEAEGIVAAGLRIEKLMGAPQDIEWGFDERGLWILQARPQTALAT